MQIEQLLKSSIVKCFDTVYHESLASDSIKIEITGKDHIGDLTFVVFPYLKISKQKPEETAENIGNYIIMR